MSKDLEVFDSLKADIALFVAPTKQIAVVDPDTANAAIDTAKQIKTWLATVEKKRKELVGPLNDRVKLINEYVKTITAPLAEAEDHIRTQLNDHARKQEEIRREELRKAEEARREAERIAAEKRAQEEAELRAKQEQEAELARQGAELFGGCDEDADAEKARAEQAERERLELEAKHDRERLARLVEDKQKQYDANAHQIKNTRQVWKCEMEDESKVPREFLIVTLNEKAVIAAAKAGVKIPGVRVWTDVAVAIGAKTYMPKVTHG